MKVGVIFGEDMNARDQLMLSELADSLGYSYIWFGEHAGIRDAIAMSAAAAAVTERANVGTCAINPYTRNVGTVAATAITLDDITGGRFSIGVASGEEFIGAFGVVKERPLDEMNEFINSLRSLLSGKEVSVEGTLVKLRNARAARKASVPVYVAATGFRMLRLGSKISDGVIFNFLVNDVYMQNAVKASSGAASKFQLITASIADDRKIAVKLAKIFVAKFIFLAPDFFKGIGIPLSVVDAVGKKIRGWPPSQHELENAASLIPEDVAVQLTALGNAGEAAQRISEEAKRWGTTPVIYFLSDNTKRAIEGLISHI